MKSREITLLDTLMVAIVGGIVSGLVVYLIPKVVGAVCKFVKSVTIKSKYKIKKKIKYYKGEITAGDYMYLKQKPPEKLTRHERKIIEDTERVWQEQMKEFSETHKNTGITSVQELREMVRDTQSFKKH
ncbi:hypothetical protein [Bacillus cereus]|uniref:Uncharacterized protein n=2 Tax=Bacillus TaxID=1386 RepID=A0A9X6Q815_BACTU|nr:hypothetical protein BT4G5_03600 [Bacillus thuringiensis serovar galleriae]ETE93507.1 hypothetical protein C621_0209335 [Bacillus thuringiensis serovar aizawai str. Leapi01]ETE95120.1 hypothetical protein C623_0223000 [Bacillus thuringiensis serovar aizawai str. Hu4-2]KMP99365.1 hypothetical protein TU66_28635 [Bacillus cereus]OIX19027.1 hypothetical protein BMT18_15705 [Bacillus thuringiensis serovar aizawai]OUA19789.1 hypothetical protein BK775_24505 [Bacillus thuringiensis]